ncbi:MAG: protein kinase [Kofleriaceae bacterium]
MNADGELLSDRLRRGPLPIDQAIAIARQIAAALAAAHAVSMIHRTLEPANIRLDGDRVTLLDFDIASTVRPPGSPRYLAPECTSSAHADRRSDVYALGCILFEMIIGQLPVEGAALPDDLDPTLTAMLAKDPAARPAMADVVTQLGTRPAGLHAELERYTETKQWTKAVETIDKLAALEASSLRRGAYAYTAALICRDELADREAAVSHFDDALDSYFSDPGAIPEPLIPVAIKGFSSIERLLTKHEDWKTLDREHRKMIVRLRGTPRFDKLQAELYDKLGEIYRSRLGHTDAAISAFEAAQKLDPDNQVKTEGIDRLAILEELQGTNQLN